MLWGRASQARCRINSLVSTSITRCAVHEGSGRHEREPVNVGQPCPRDSYGKSHFGHRHHVDSRTQARAAAAAIVVVSGSTTRFEGAPFLSWMPAAFRALWLWA